MNLWLTILCYFQYLAPESVCLKEGNIKRPCTRAFNCNCIVLTSELDEIECLDSRSCRFTTGMYTTDIHCVGEAKLDKENSPCCC
jgi:hypothetical protein